ncbi:hypothetical protein DCC85_17380 [Paenibacillus sp. CAA11]|uniref:hypothetical protein n=1 Tax=Paenibacillus sp. CAA11 TaxID=1532905 RepID=UPI000D39026B|nr:hypothetical protein [Paenibacillus sp. CAA11]AWB45782.1 hypothetical protein DCC85_17380 [Paenibacillus sp. CAA11]
MYNISKAEFRRLTDLAGLRCAEIEVSSDDAGSEDLLVYVARAKQTGDYEIVHMYSTKIDPQIDWYNENLNNAYEEIAEEDFGAATWPEAGGEVQRENFRQSLLSYGNISEKLEQMLPKGGA